MSDENYIPKWLQKAIRDEIEALNEMGQKALSNTDKMAAHDFAARINALNWVLQQRPPS